MDTGMFFILFLWCEEECSFGVELSWKEALNQLNYASMSPLFTFIEPFKTQMDDNKMLYTASLLPIMEKKQKK